MIKYFIKVIYFIQISTNDDKQKTQKTEINKKTTNENYNEDLDENIEKYSKTENILPESMGINKNNLNEIETSKILNEFPLNH